METLQSIGMCCLLPLALCGLPLVAGYWLGRGAPGWPWVLAPREEIRRYGEEE